MRDGERGGFGQTAGGGGVTRRQVLRAAGAGGVLLLAGGLTGCDPGEPPASSGPALTSPPERISAGGRLDVTLVAAPATVADGGSTRPAFTYNGGTPGPTLRVRPGDVLTVTLVNHLDEPTSLHTHGLHVSPTGAGDNPFVTVPAGAQRTYRYQIPADHRSGLFWYHPHVHGRVAAQVAAGLVGAIVVEDAVDAALRGVAPEDTILVLADPLLGADPTAADPMTRMAGREGEVVLVNGRRQPRLAGRAGTLVRWRLLNASPSRFYALSLEGHDFHVIASDGGRLDRPRPVGEVLLVPGERVEVLVALPRAGSFALRTRPVSRGTTMMGEIVSTAAGPLTLATLVVAGADAGPPAVPATIAPLDDLRGLVPARTRDVTLSMGMGGMGGMGGGMMGGGQHGGMADGGFLIDGRSYAEGRVDIAARLGTVEDWVVRNSSTMHHPFHLHTWPFQVLERSDGAAVPGWKDTVDVPAGGWVRLRIPFRDLAGRTVHHCHILDHEDLGMMGTIEVR
jgi:FtsP/CotA-like multicopper oxidase with cupredoxin domain